MHICVCVSVCAYIWSYLSVPMCVSIFISGCMYLCVCLSVSVSMSMSASISVSISSLVSLSPSLPLPLPSPSTCVYLYLCVYQCLLLMYFQLYQLLQMRKPRPKDVTQLTQGPPPFVSCESQSGPTAGVCRVLLHSVDNSSTAVSPELCPHSGCSIITCWMNEGVNA